MRIVIGEIILEGTPQELAEYDRLTNDKNAEYNSSVVRLMDDGGNVVSAYEWIDGVGYVEVTF